MRKALDPLVLHVIESVLRKRSRGQTLSFGESLDGTRDILLVAARNLTDLLAIAPAAEALRQRFRLARVHVLASESCAGLLQGRSEIFSVVPLPDPKLPLLSRDYLSLVRELSRLPFDLAVAVDDGGDRAARALAALVGARLRVGVHPEGQDPTLNLVVAAPAGTGYRAAQSLEFLQFLGIPREDLVPGWDVPAKDRQYAKRLLELRRRGREGWLLGVDPGAGLGGIRPSPDKLAWIVNRLVSARGALPIILTEDPEDPGIVEFERFLKSPALGVATRGVRDMLSFTTCCDVVLAGNTSLFHFAAALKAPTIGLIDPGEDARWVPEETPRLRVLRWVPGERVVEADILATADEVRRSRVVDLPIRLEPDEPSPVRTPASEPVETGEAARTA